MYFNKIMIGQESGTLATPSLFLLPIQILIKASLVPILSISFETGIFKKSKPQA